jgi:uncharacterized membrane protein YraQ (UPF0718 family)
MNKTRQHGSVTAPMQQPYAVAGIVVFLLMAIVGLFYAKWFPYYDRAFVAASTHSIGTSILTGTAATPPAPSLQAALGYALAYGKSIWQALVLGLLLGSAVQALLPRQWIVRWLGDSSLSGIMVAGMLAVPSMMCTCCSAPVVKGLRQSHAGAGSAVTYWLGNTMLNPATLIFIGFVLGWHWMELRLITGLLMVFGLGWLVRRISLATNNQSLQAPHASATANNNTTIENTHIFQRWLHALIDMSWRLLPEYLVIVLLLGAARAWLFPALDMSVDNSLIWIVGLALAGTLFVIPTAGEVPIVQAALSLGMATGPAAALLVTLPPVSLPSLAMLAKSFRLRELAVLVAGVVVLGVLAGGFAIALNFQQGTFSVFW